MRARAASPPPASARRRLHLDVRRRPHHPAATNRVDTFKSQAGAHELLVVDVDAA